MARGYNTPKHPGGKHRGGGNKQATRAQPRPSKHQSGRKAHDTMTPAGTNAECHSQVESVAKARIPPFFY